MKTGPAAVTAQAEQALRNGGYEYAVLKDGTVEITKYTGAAKKVTTLGALSGRVVTAIGRASFAGAGIDRVTVSEGVRSVGSSAFSGCKTLKKVTLPVSLRKIETHDGAKRRETRVQEIGIVQA